MLVREIMTTRVHTIGQDASIRDAARLLVDNDVSAAPVLDAGGRLVGMVSEIDLIRRDVPPDQRGHARRVHMAAEAPPRAVADVMTSGVLAVDAGTDVADVVAVMSDRHVKSLPVVEDAYVVGIVSRRDVVRALLRDDDLLRVEVARRLAEAVPGSWLVRVNDGTVELRGGHGPQDEAIAVSTAATVPGVVHVVLEPAPSHSG